VRKKLQAGELVVGTMISELRSPGIIRMLDTAGMDFVIIDAEHGPYNYETLANMAAVGTGLNICCLARIPEISRETIMKPLDVGMHGLVIPQVETAEQVQQVIYHAKYPPMGHRGVALRRGHSGYASYPAREYLESANKKTIIAIQIESLKAVTNVEEIISVPGVDIAFVGPFDLSVDMGIPGEINNIELAKAVHKVIHICEKHNIVVGIMQFTIEVAKKWISEGIRFMVYSSDINMIADQATLNIKILKGSFN
jgi:2-keto-3-deoxy-L-rhamnonate aldolase RhmA